MEWDFKNVCHVIYFRLSVWTNYLALLHYIPGAKASNINSLTDFPDGEHRHFHRLEYLRSYIG